MRAFLFLLTTAIAAFSLTASHSSPDIERAAAATLVTIKAGVLRYYPPGEFLQDGRPVTPTPVNVRIERDFQIMRRQVSQAEYAACVSAGACQALDAVQRGGAARDLPVAGVNWLDAQAYAGWLSARSGQIYRLPTYAEWAYAAGPEFVEEFVADTVDGSDPAQRWLAEYELKSRRKQDSGAQLCTFGSFGVNGYGVLDMQGNVWDWTDSCHTREHYGGQGAEPISIGRNCGVRVVAGVHRSYIPDFIRDPKGGACSVGMPPSNLGIRLIRDMPSPLA